MPPITPQRAIFVICLIAACLLTASAIAKPPHWAPAHGWRAKHRYVYYPKVQVYYAPERRVYYWHDEGRWQMGIKLPPRIVIDPSRGISLELDTVRPYTEHMTVIRTYPSLD